jgi:hypothetical protein
LQELIDIGSINASFVQELSSIASDENIVWARTMEWMRLLPQGSELFNRIATGLAVLDVTNGDVDAADTMIKETHIDYALQNRPRYFRRWGGGFHLPQFFSMFKMYAVGIFELTARLTVDAVSRRGQTPGQRARAASALAGLIVMNVLSAGLVRGLFIEQIRLLRAIWNVMFGDDDEPDDLNSAVERWAAELTGSSERGQILSYGIWNALGFDLSARMGMDRMLVFDPPEEVSEDEGWKFIGSVIGGYMLTQLIQKGTRAYDMFVFQGKPVEAFISLVPIRLVQDAMAAWKLMNRGVTTTSGQVVVPPDAFNAFDVSGRFLGARTSEESMASEKASTVHHYKTWKAARVRELLAAYWRAKDSNDPAALAAANAAINRFNEKNPGAKITGRSKRQSKQASEQVVEERQGKGRNKDLNKRLDY